MINTVILYGPQGCGKTRHAETLRRNLGCKHVVDGWMPGDTVEPGGLHLTFIRPNTKHTDQAKLITFAQAMRRGGQRHG